MRTHRLSLNLGLTPGAPRPDPSKPAVMLDGVELEGVTRIILQASVKEPVVATITLQVMVDGEFEVRELVPAPEVEA